MINVAVIGTIFIDCKGFAKQDYQPLGRNLGDIQFVHGGVARNVAENLGNLQLPTSFVSTVDQSAIGKEVMDRLICTGVHTDFVAQIDKCGMGMWLAILNEQGDLAGSVSQMPDLACLEKLIKEQGRGIVKSTSHIVLELDLNAAITRMVIQLAKEYHKPVYGIPGNLDVILKNRDILSDLTCFICNHVEAGRLFGIDFGALSMEEMQVELGAFVKKIGLANMVVTLGGNGCVYYDLNRQTAGYQTVFPVHVVDSSGAGDAFFSGTVMGLIKQKSLKEAVILGTRVAAWTIGTSENTCLDLSKKIATDDLFCVVVDEAAVS